MTKRERVGTWMPVVISEYDQKSARLSLAEDGAYFRLCRDYWVNGPIPDDDDRLAGIVRLGRKDWMKIRPALEPLFDIRDGRWFHPHLDGELARAREFRERQVENGRKGGRPRKPTQTQDKPMGYFWVLKNRLKCRVFENPSKSPIPLPLLRRCPIQVGSYPLARVATTSRRPSACALRCAA